MPHHALERLPILACLILLWLFPSPWTPAAGEDAESLQARGDAAFAAGDLQRARQAYRRALEGAPAERAAVIRHQLAFVERALGHHQAALELFLTNLRQHQGQGRRQWAAPNYLYAGELLLDLDRPEEAVALLRDYPWADDPDHSRRARVFRLLALALERLGDQEAARAVIADAKRRVEAATWQQELAADAARLAPPPPDPLWPCGPLALMLPVALALIPPLRRRHGRWLLLAFSTAAALMLAELLARHWFPDPGAVRHFLNPPHSVFRFRPAAGLMPGIDYAVSTFTVNDIGLRGNDLSQAGAAPRILVIGGSSVEALFVDDADAWPRVAQEQLRRQGRALWIANAGKSGLDSFAHRVQLHHALREIHPHAVVIQLGINDLNRCISGGRQRLRRDALAARRPDFHQRHPGVYAQILPPTLPRLALARLLTRHSPPPPSGAQGVPQDEAGRFLEAQRRRRRQAEIIDQPPPIDDCLAIFRDNLERLTDQAEAAGTRLAFLTQGSLYRDDLPEELAGLLWFGSVDEGFFAPTPPTRYYSVGVMARLLERYNRATLELCRRRRLPCMDVDRHLPKDTRSYYDDVHLNREGSRRLGMALAHFIHHRLLPP